MLLDSVAFSAIHVYRRVACTVRAGTTERLELACLMPKHTTDPAVATVHTRLMQTCL